MIGQDGRIAGAVIDDHAIEPLVGVDDVLRAVAGEVGHGQLDGLVGLVVGLERAVAVAQQHQDIAVGVADEQVELAVAVDVGDGQAVGFGRHRVGGRRQEAPLAVAEVDAHAVGGQDGQVVDAVAGEVGHADDLGRALGGDASTGLANRPPPRPASTSERVRAGVDRHQVGRAARRERPGGHARRRLQAGDLERAAGIDLGQAGPGAIGDGGGEAAVAQVAAGR